MAKGSPAAAKSIEEICALPRKRLAADLRAVQARLEVVAAKRRRFARKLQAATDEETRLALQAQMISLALQLHGNGAAAVAHAAAAPAGPDRSISGGALSIVRQGEGLPVTPRRVRERLAELGLAADERVIRTALRRWVARGMLVKDGRAYRAVAAGQDPPELPVDPA
ncbi:MAG TPA: hypothetical protein VFV85_06015 [Conexibacter sp.]|nr:hypothetical protein [Conexibacter sp.]